VTWAASEQIWWHYRRPDWTPGAPEYVDPMTVVRDDADRLVAWLAPGTPVLQSRPADGRAVRDVPLAERLSCPRVQGRSTWYGSGSLRILRPGDPWSVCLFWDDDWQLACWYVNLEGPHLREGRHTYTNDHLLDVVVRGDRTVHRKDEDELAAAVAQGVLDALDAQDAEQIIKDAERAERAVAAWTSPFCDGWQHWRPRPVVAAARTALTTPAGRTSDRPCDGPAGMAETRAQGRSTRRMTWNVPRCRTRSYDAPGTSCSAYPTPSRPTPSRPTPDKVPASSTT